MENTLDELIGKIEAQKQSLRTDPSYAQYAYVTHDDLKNVNWQKKSETQGIDQ